MKEIVGFETSNLCFNKEEFFKDDFSVDTFVLRYRQQAGLESLRNDLGVYLKVLRSSMIDLINRDYADFVNLSSNLVGLDANISKLETPLGQLREEVLSVRRSFDDLLAQTSGRLARLHEVRAQKQYLRLLGSLPGYLERIESLLSSSEPPASDQEGDVMERAASEYNQLTYALSHCRGAALVSRLEPRLQRAGQLISGRLQDALMSALDRKDAEALAHVLRIYATLDQVAVAESLYRQRIVEPYMEEAISPSALRDNPRGLRGLLQHVLQFVPDHAQLLISVTHKEHGGHTGPRYDFLVNSVWPVIVQKLDDELSVIYAPGNPNTFFERYTASMEFVEQFEAACGSRASVDRLRNHPAYQAFLKHWNLPVYYQIRFQEIAGELETILSGSQSSDPEAAGSGPEAAGSGGSEAAGSGSPEAAGAAVWRALERCWSRQVFLRPLTHRFWQLSLQVLARYCTWLDGRLSVAQDKGSSMSLSECVQSLSDIRDLCQRLDTFVEETVLPMTPDLPEEALRSMKASLSVSVSQLQALPARLTQVYTSTLIDQASVPMRAVSDIPRLYRRTNRDPPTAPSAYVAAMVAPLRHFQEHTCSQLQPQLTAEYLQNVLVQLCTLYTERVGDVLTSVQRMEESLRRLKKSRPAGASGAGVSDDDKIRRQLALDVSSLAESIEQLGLEPSQIEPYHTLKTRVAQSLQNQL